MSSLYGRFLRSVVFPLGDRIRRIPIGEALELLEESQWWIPERIREFQDEKLRRLVRTAYESVPYYREAMDARRLRPADIRTIDDLPKLPLLTKADVREAWPDRIRNRDIPVSRLYVHRTGGSTGEPMFFYLSGAARAFDRASFYRFLRWCGSDRGELIFSVWGRIVVADRHTRLVRAAKIRFVTRQILLDAFRMTPETMHRFVRLLWRYRPEVLRGYTSALVDLAEFVRAEGLTTPPLKALTTTAEQVVVPQRRILEETFAAPLFDQYGCGEVGGVAYECERHSALHIASEHCVVEVVDDEGMPRPPGEPGRIALTNLDNEAMPFIRYVNGDEAALLPGACACGRGLPLMSPISGRTADVIHGVNGNRAHGEFFTHLLHELGWTEGLPVREFQVVQTHEDRLRVDVAADRAPSGEEVRRFVGKVREYLGAMQVEFRRVERVERGASGKRRFTIREWAPTAANEPARVGAGGGRNDSEVR